MPEKFQKGGAFLVEDAGSARIFIPEHLTSEQKGLAEAVAHFVGKEVLPKSDAIERQEPGLMPALLKEAAKLGFLMAEVPAEYGGLDLGKIEATAIAEGTSLQASFNVAFMCHTGIGISPLVSYGTEEQKQKYLPRLAGGEMLAAFALTEPGAGSDAMAIKTTARPSADKKYFVLNGSKQFITNGGFADLFTVFAKLDGAGITAFLVEKAFKGLEVGKEEEKMGIHGSSTVTLNFDNVRVPAGNLLGEPGKGHHIAFNILNAGRLKLGAACTSACRRLVNTTHKYVSERVQFGRPIIFFQIIQQKLAMMVARTLLLESISYRSAGMFDGRAKAAAARGEGAEPALREYALEAAISKVFGSEALFQVADDALQLHGGYGYCREYGIEAQLRDSRINRIYEGTNEINRLVISGTLLKLAASGKIDIMGALADVEKKIRELLSGTDITKPESVIYTFVEVMKRICLWVGAAAAGRFGPALQDEEFILAGIADMVMDLYALESGYIRGRELGEGSGKERGRKILAATYYYMMNRAADVLDTGRRLFMRISPADAAAIGNYNKVMFGCLNIINGDQQALAKEIIDEVGKAGKYPFSPFD